MAVSANLYFPVNSIAQNTLSNQKVFAGLALTANPLIPTTNPVKKFTSKEAVGAFFGLSSTEYQAAVKYFKSYTSALQVPPYIYFGKYVYQAIAPYLRSGVATNTATLLTALQAITAGDITVKVNGVSYATTAIDLHTASSLSNVASLLTTDIVTANTALNPSGLNFTITWDAVNKQFVASVPGTGATSTMDYFSSSTSPNLANTLAFTLATGAVLSQGKATTSAADNMQGLAQNFTDQFSIFFVDTMSGGLTDAVNLGVAQWVSDQGDKYCFVLWDDAVALQSDTDTTSIWYQCTQAELSNISFFDEVLYNNDERAAAYSGMFASIDLTRPNSAITAAFKTQDGLIPSVTLTEIAEILDEKKINYYANVGISGTTEEKNWFYGGFTSGKWAYTDNLVAAIWTQVQCQISISSFFGLVPQVPNDPSGDVQVRSILSQVCEDNKINGIIATGLTFDAATNQALIQQGINPQELTNNGYVILKNPSSQSQRQDRESSPWTIVYTKKSAVQYLPITSITYY